MTSHNIRKMIAVIYIIATGLLFSACGTGDSSQNDSIQTGDVVTVNYTLTWSDDTIFASNISGTTLATVPSRSLERIIQETFVAGDSSTPRSNAVVGLLNQATLEKTITPEESNQEQNNDPKKAQTIAADAFETNVIPTLYDHYTIGGQQARITSIEGSGPDQTITFDLNPRETRDTYSYEITVTDIIKQ